MEETKFKFGPIQTAWLKSLKENPERQQKNKLATKNKDGTYRACCLGEAGLIAGVCEWNEDGFLTPKNLIKSCGYLYDVYTEIGLYDASGCSKDRNQHETLSNYNDTGTTWPEIAAMIEANPEKWLKESK